VTTLLSVPFAIVLTAFVGILLLALLAATALLVLLALLALDVLLERNGVDRRTGLHRAWDRLRGPAPAPGRPGEGRGDASTARGAERDADGGAAPRIPFSARRSFRTTRTAEPMTTPAAETAPNESAISEQTAPPAPAAPTAMPAAESPAPAADAVTEVVAVDIPPAPRARAVRTPRIAPARTSDPGPDSAPEPEPATESPADRDSAIDRLFAPLLDSDKTEPLPTPRAARPARKPRDQG
jgi:hypothetical protein